jgi:hypothetical protein
MSPVSRLAVDMERFSEDTTEPMAAIGMAPYTHGRRTVQCYEHRRTLTGGNACAIDISDQTTVVLRMPST